MSSQPKPRGLGRGLDGMFPSRPVSIAETPTSANPRDGQLFRCPVEKLVPQEGQPRQHFEPEALQQLASSLQLHGMIEPIAARPTAGGRFEIIAGERRWRAAQLAGLLEVPVIVREIADDDVFELAIVENAQREDLGAIEFAEALQKLQTLRGYTQEQLAERVGKDRSTVANALRLLKLPEAIRARVVRGELSEGHGRALLGAPDEATMAEIADKVVKGRLPVRKTEQLVRKAKAAASGAPSAKKSTGTKDLERRLSQVLGCKVEVSDKGGSGKVVIHYPDLDVLDGVVERILGR